MFSRVSHNVIVDLLFILLLIFISLFFLSFAMVNEPKEKEDQAKNDNNILVTMRWNTDNDMDLWLRLPDGRHVGYNNRDEPPAHLDVDVVAWRKYRRPDNTEYTIENNEEIITIRDTLEGEYVVNVHYYSAHRIDPMQPIEVEIMVQDVENGKIVYADSKKINMTQKETNFLRFSVERYRVNGIEKYRIVKIYTDRPMFFVGKREGSRDVHFGEED